MYTLKILSFLITSMKKENIIFIKPTTKTSLDLDKIWLYKDLLWALTLKDIKLRYNQTIFGVLWALFQPLTIVFILYIFFGRLIKVPYDGPSYMIFVFSAISLWIFFNNTVFFSINLLLSSSNLINKIYFPKLIIPFSVAGSNFIDFIVSFFILIIFLLFKGIIPSIYFIYFIFLLLLIALGTAAFLSAITVVYRDIKYIIPFFMQIWMYSSPIIYPVSIIPEKWQTLYYLNPITSVIEGFRNSMLGEAIDLHVFLASSFFSFTIFIVGIYYFRTVEKNMADII